MNLKTLSLITIPICLIVIYLNFTFFSETSIVFTVINLAAALIVLGIPLLYRYSQYSKIKKLEYMFPKFLRDVTKNINTGMTLPQAVRTACSNDYDILTKYVKEMDAKISWGISFEKILIDFSERTGSENLKRTVQTIIEAHRSGGTVNTVLEAVADSLQEIEKIKKERSTSIYAQMINGYLIYLVFLGVMIGLSTFLLPAFQWEEIEAGDMRTIFLELFRSLIIIQGIFAGLAVGKMAEGTFIAGIKHSLALSVLGYVAFLIFV
jgi:flagellar protein FlaJ